MVYLKKRYAVIFGLRGNIAHGDEPAGRADLNDEFLTFTHQGNMCFTVDIYQIDGKELLTPRRSATIASSSGKYFIYVIAFLMLKEKNEEEDSA